MYQSPLLIVSGARWCFAKFRDNKIPFLSSMFIGLLCYMYAFTNKLLNHDEARSLFIKGATVTSGRWGLGALDTVFPNHSMPWIYGIISIVLISTAICIILRILSIRNPVLQALLSGTVIAFPSLIGTFAYMFTASSFALSFLIAVLAVWFLQRKGIWNTLLALGCMIFSLSIYQSYISLAAGLLVVLLLQQTLRLTPFQTLIRTGIGYVLFLVASLGLYYVATEVILILKDVAFNDYASGNMGFSIANIPAAIAEAYRSFLRFFTEGYRGLIPTRFSRYLHAALLLASLVLLICRMVHLRSIPHIILAAALTVILPLAVNCMYLFTTADAVHTLVLYGFVNLYALFVVLAECSLPCAEEKTAFFTNAAVNILTFLMALIIVCNTYLANQAWLNLHLRYENAYAFYTSLLSDLQQMPEFDENCSIALIGNYQDPAFYSEHFEFLSEITGTKGFLPDSYSKQFFMEYYLGVSIPFVTDAQAHSLSALPQVQQMNTYPYYGSICMIDKTIVIKLS